MGGRPAQAFGQGAPHGTGRQPASPPSPGTSSCPPAHGTTPPSTGAERGIRSQQTRNWPRRTRLSQNFRRRHIAADGGPRAASRPGRGVTARPGGRPSQAAAARGGSAVPAAPGSRSRHCGPAGVRTHSTAAGRASITTTSTCMATSVWATWTATRTRLDSAAETTDPAESGQARTRGERDSS